jgi:hypothetical protein
VGEPGHARLGRRAVLRAHVNGAGRVLADEYGREARRATGALDEIGNTLGDLGADRRGRGFSVDKASSDRVPEIRLVSAPSSNMWRIWMTMITTMGEKSIPPKSGRSLRIGR